MPLFYEPALSGIVVIFMDLIAALQDSQHAAGYGGDKSSGNEQAQ